MWYFLIALWIIGVWWFYDTYLWLGIFWPFVYVWLFMRTVFFMTLNFFTEPIDDIV